MHVPIVPLHQRVHTSCVVMEIEINIDDEVPLFTQVMEQIKQAVSAGHCLPGSALPSIRQLSSDLEINSKTVAKAYRLLERDQIIQTKGHRGTFVHPNAKANCTINLQERAVADLTRAIQTLKNVNLTDSEIRNAFALVMNGQGPKGQ